MNDSSTLEDDEKDKFVVEVLIYGNRYEVVDRNTSAVLKIIDTRGTNTIVKPCTILSP